MSNILRRLNQIEELALGFTLLGLAFFVFVQVVLRYLFHFAYSWAEELGRYLIIFITFFGASLGVKYGTHFSVEAVAQVLPERLRHAVKALANFVCGLFFLLVIYYACIQISKLHQYGTLSATLRIPMYVPYLPIPFFSMTMGFRFFHLSYTHALSFLRNETIPEPSPVK